MNDHGKRKTVLEQLIQFPQTIDSVDSARGAMVSDLQECFATQKHPNAANKALACNVNTK